MPTSQPKPRLKLPRVLTLGKASLEVFCAHIVFVFIALALLYGEFTQLNGRYAAFVLAFTFAGLILVATRAALRDIRRKPTQAASNP